jgi:preprotein translocase subunit SecG
MSIYNYITFVTMVLMTVLILIQTRGSSGEMNTERRGTDKTIYQLTIILAFIFAASIMLGIVVA